MSLADLRALLSEPCPVHPGSLSLSACMVDVSDYYGLISELCESTARAGRGSDAAVTLVSSTWVIRMQLEHVQALCGER